MRIKVSLRLLDTPEKRFQCGDWQGSRSAVYFIWKFDSALTNDIILIQDIIGLNCFNCANSKSEISSTIVKIVIVEASGKIATVIKAPDSAIKPSTISKGAIKKYVSKFVCEYYMSCFKILFSY